jgi:catechol 2,3-dioxygenase-like lactoylglutathione lyase family enzyme
MRMCVECARSGKRQKRIRQKDIMMTDDPKPRLVGINHVALEVGNVEEALSFYRAIFSFELRGSRRDETGRMKIAFLDMGDQFLALSEGRKQGPDDGRHFGLVVDDRSNVRVLAKRSGATMIEGSLNFFDPWGNRIEVVEYGDVQFTKDKVVLDAMKLSLEKSERAKAELAEKGIENNTA